MRYALFIGWLAIGQVVPSFAADEYIRRILPAHRENGRVVYSIPDELPGVEFAPEEMRLADIEGTAFLFLLYDGLTFKGFRYGQYAALESPLNEVDEEGEPAQEATEEELVETHRRPWLSSTPSMRLVVKDTVLAAFDNYATRWNVDASLRERVRSALSSLADDQRLHAETAANRLLSAWAIFVTETNVSLWLDFSLVPLHSTPNSVRVNLVENAVKRILEAVLRFLATGNPAYLPALASKPPFESLPSNLQKRAIEAARNFSRGISLQNQVAQASMIHKPVPAKCAKAVLDSSTSKQAQLRMRTR